MKSQEDLVQEAIPNLPKALAHELTDDTPKKQFNSVAFYRQALSKNLSPDILKADPSRLIWYFSAAALSVGSFLIIVNGGFSWPIKLALGVFVGFCNGTMSFVTHEIYHGSVIKNQKVQNILGFFGALPFFISPTFWRFWHNRLHHGKTQQLIRDPDAFPNLKIYKQSTFIKAMFPFTPGSGHKRSYAYFFFWFSFHNFVAQTYLRFRNKIFAGLDQKQVNLEFGLQVLIGGALLTYSGPRNWPYVFLAPLVVQNYLLMSYISTNHNLSPLTQDNDPLINSLTVTNHPVLEFLNLNFGYHVEHHIFPQASSSKIKAVHNELKKQFPESFQVMPKWKAVKALYSTSRIYKNSNQLVNPKTMKTYQTLGS
jgi:fatty acid desaturase